MFLEATATFGETLFPHCKSAQTPSSTQLGGLPPVLPEESHNHSDRSSNDGNDHDQCDRPLPPAKCPSAPSPDQPDPDVRNNKSKQGTPNEDAATVPPNSPLVPPCTLSQDDFELRRSDQAEWKQLPPH